jgi:hypothetical protein
MVQTMIKIEHFFVPIDWCQQIFFVTSCAVSAYFTSRQSSVSINDHLSLTFRLLTWLVLIVEFFRTGDLPNLNRFNLDGSVVIVMKMVKGVMKFMGGGGQWRKMAKNGEKWRWRIRLLYLSNSPFFANL